MKKILIILAILILASCSWKTHDKVLFGVGAGLHALDMYSTYHYVEDGTELNSLYSGMKPWEAVGTMAITFVAVYIAAEVFEAHRTPLLSGYLGVKTAITINNIEFGIP